MKCKTFLLVETTKKVADASELKILLLFILLLIFCLKKWRMETSSAERDRPVICDSRVPLGPTFGNLLWHRCHRCIQMTRHFHRK